MAEFRKFSPDDNGKNTDTWKKQIRIYIQHRVDKQSCSVASDEGMLLLQSQWRGNQVFAHQ